MDTLPPHTPSDRTVTSAGAIEAAHGKVNRPTPELAEAIERGYEPKDINLRGLFIFLGTLVVSLVVVLCAIYGILMAMVEYDRSHDPLGTPVSVSRPEQYAPLQPSVGHNVLDTDDMAGMREQVQDVLRSPKLSRQMPIDQAMLAVVPMLIVRPAVMPTKPAEYPAGSIEGRYGPVAVELGVGRPAE